MSEQANDPEIERSGSAARQSLLEIDEELYWLETLTHHSVAGAALSVAIPAAVAAHMLSVFVTSSSGEQMCLLKGRKVHHLDRRHI